MGADMTNDKDEAPEANSREFTRGRIQGLKDAADILRAVANIEAAVRVFIPGQVPKMARGLNRGLLGNAARIIPA